MINGQKATLPDFLLVGASRSGTTSLMRYLAEHPGVFMPIKRKTTLFFPFADRPKAFEYPESHPARNIICSFEEFAKHFSTAAAAQSVGAHVLLYENYCKDTIANIRKYMPQPDKLKIIITLREPAERAYSMYSLNKQNGHETLEFEEALARCEERMKERWHPEFDYIGLGFYYDVIRAYMENFQQVRVYLFDDLKADSAAFMKDVFTFLGVDNSFRPHTKRVHNYSGQPRLETFHRILTTSSAISSRLPMIKWLLPLDVRAKIVGKLRDINLVLDKKQMKDQTKEDLRKIYREDILKLQELIGRDLSAWLE